MKRAIAILIFLGTSAAYAVDLAPIAVLGTAVAGRQEAWHGHVNFVAWLGNDAVAFADESGVVKCYSLSKKPEQWNKTIGGTIRQLSVGNGKLFVLGDHGTIHVLAATTGESLKQLDRKALATIAGFAFLIPNNIAWVPTRNALVVSTYSEGYGENSLLLDGQSFKLIGRVKTEGFLTDLCPTQDGSHIVALSRANNIRIWSIDQTREVFRLGEDKVAAVDAPFMSNAMFDGKNTLVYSIDNSWATGMVYVYDTQNKKQIARFDSQNGHLEMDVDFTSSRVALTGTSEGLVLANFEGRVLAMRNKAADQRIVAVKFSPDRSRLAVGSWDNTVRIFEIKDDSNKSLERDKK